MRKPSNRYRSLAGIPPHTGGLFGAVLCVSMLAPLLRSQESGRVGSVAGPPPAKIEDRNEPLNSLNLPTVDPKNGQIDEYRIGAGDLLEITVLEAAELNRSLRVSATGEISMPPLGNLKVAGLIPQELEAVIQELLRRSIMKDPHVAVFVREMESHPVSVTGAVKKPGVYQISGPKSLLEMLSRSEGLADDAGNTVLVMRGANFPAAKTRAPEKGGTALAEATLSSPASPGAATVEVDIKNLLNSHDPRYNILVYPGDVVKVSRAGIVYVLGDVKKPGGFLLHNNENISVLQALALAEGLAPTSAKSQARIIRTDDTSGQRTEIPLDLGKVMQGKTPDTQLQSKDVVFIPKSGGKSAVFRSAELILGSVPGALVYRTW